MRGSKSLLERNLMILDLYAVISNLAVKVAHFLIGFFFSDVSYFCVACVCNDYHRKNQSRYSKMGLTSHLSYAYDAFSSSCVSFSLLLSLMKMALTNLTMKVLGLCSPAVRAFLHVLKYPLIVLVHCHLIESLYQFVVFVEYF